MDLLHEVVHECLQGNIISENGLCVRCSNTAIAASCVGCRWVELRQQESSLGSTSITNDESRQWEAVGDEFLWSVSLIEAVIKSR